jgi:hypothetical protein
LQSTFGKGVFKENVPLRVFDIIRGVFTIFKLFFLLGLFGIFNVHTFASAFERWPLFSGHCAAGWAANVL